MPVTVDLRIKDLSNTATVTAADDFAAIDGATNGTRKINIYNPWFGGNVITSGSVLFGTALSTSSGLVQIPVSTNPAAGVSFGGTEIQLYRAAAGNLALASTAASAGAGLDVSSTSSAGRIKVASAGSPRLLVVNTSAAANQTTFGLESDATNLYFKAYSDDLSGSNPFLTLTRGSGYTVSSATWGVPVTTSTMTVTTVSGPSATNLILNGGSSGASLTLGQGSTAGDLTSTPTGSATAGGFVLSRRTSNNALRGTYNYGTDSFRVEQGVGYTALVTEQNNALVLGISGVEKMRLSPTNANLLIGGTTDITGSGGLNVFGSTAATSTTSGAFQVVGGAGFGGNIYSGGGVSVANGISIGTQPTSPVNTTGQITSGLGFSLTSGTTSYPIRFVDGSRGLTLQTATSGGNNGTWWFGYQDATPTFTGLLKLEAGPVNNGSVNRVQITPANFSYGGFSTTNGGAIFNVQSTTGTDIGTAASGINAAAVFSAFNAPTLAASNASVTTTDAATVYISGGPNAGTNQTITNSWGLWNAGKTRLDGSLLVAPSTGGTVATFGATANNTAIAITRTGGVSTTISSHSFDSYIASTGTLHLQGNSTELMVLGQSSSTLVNFPGSAGISVSSATDSTNTTNGSGVFSGGIGVAKSANIGGNLSVTGTSTLTGYTTVKNYDVTQSFTSRVGQDYLYSDGATSNRMVLMQPGSVGAISGSDLTYVGSFYMPNSSVSPTASIFSIAGSALGELFAWQLTAEVNGNDIIIRQTGANQGTDQRKFVWTGGRTTYGGRWVRMIIGFSGNSTTNPQVWFDGVDVSSSFAATTSGTVPNWVDSSLVTTSFSQGWSWPAGSFNIGRFINRKYAQSDVDFVQVAGRLPWADMQGGSMVSIYSGDSSTFTGGLGNWATFGSSVTAAQNAGQMRITFSNAGNVNTGGVWNNVSNMPANNAALITFTATLVSGTPTYLKIGNAQGNGRDFSNNQFVPTATPTTFSAVVPADGRGICSAGFYCSFASGSVVVDIDNVTFIPLGALSDPIILANGNLTDGTPNRIQSTSTGFSAVTPHLRGTATNDNAAVGSIGEYVSSSVSSGSAVSLTNATTGNITSISLTAGDWDVEGLLGVSVSSGATATYLFGGSSSTSATFVELQSIYSRVSLTGATTASYAIPTTRYSLSTTTTVYLVAQSGFSGGTVGGYGVLRARRVR